MRTALGAPWGGYVMGGAFPGRLPAVLRAAALIQALVLLALAAVVLARQGIAFARLASPSRWLVWVVVAVAALSVVLNVITPKCPRADRVVTGRAHAAHHEPARRHGPAPPTGLRKTAR